MDNNALDVEGLHSSIQSDVEDIHEISNVDTYDNQSVEQISTMKLDAAWTPGRGSSLTLGAYARLCQFDHTMTYLPPHPEEKDVYGSSFPSFRVRIQQNPTLKTGGYLHLKQRFLKRFLLNTGIRYDTFDLIGSQSFSPRMSVKMDVNPLFSLHAGAGRYFQNPEFLNITAHPSNKIHLRDIGCDHLIVGFNWLITPEMRLTVEAFRKDYFDYPVSADSGYQMISLANSGADYGVASSVEKLISMGKGEAEGVEFILHKKLARKSYCLISYSLSDIRHRALDDILRPGVRIRRLIRPHPQRRERDGTISAALMRRGIPIINGWIFVLTAGIF